MTKTTMKKVAATLAALSLCSAAIAPAAVSAAKITINGTTDAPVANRTFSAYQVFSVEVKGTAPNVSYVYKVNDGWENFFVNNYGIASTDAEFDAKAAAAILGSGESNSYEIQVLAQKLNAYATDNNISADYTVAAADAKEINVGEDLGYYLVVDTTAGNNDHQVISALMLDTVTADKTITLKADKPTIDKVIVEDAGDVEANNAAIGEVVNYKLTSEIPDLSNYVTYTYKITDTFSEGLTFNDDVKITIEGVDGYLPETAYSVTPTGTAGQYVIELKDIVTYADANGNGVYDAAESFTDADGDGAYDEGEAYIDADGDGTYDASEVVTKKYSTGADITVTYSATVNEKAVIGTAGNPNTVKLTYSSNPNFEYDSETGKWVPSEDTSDTPEDVVETYVTELIINKVDPDQIALDGAEFTLYSDAQCTTAIALEQITIKDGTTRWVVDQDASSTTTAVEADGGQLKIYGLAEGTYYIKETKAPDGYNLLTDVITVEVKCAEPTGEITDGSEVCEWTYEVVNSITGVTKTDNQITVVNNAGSMLPSTGGIGTTIFVVVGLALMAGAGVLFIVKRKVTAK